MQRNRKIRNMFSSVTQQNYCFISPCGIFRMSGNCLFPSDQTRGGWQGGGGRKKKTENQLPWKQLQRKEGGGSKAPLTSTSFSSSSLLCHFLLPYLGVKFGPRGLYGTQACARCCVRCKAEELTIRMVIGDWVTVCSTLSAHLYQAWLSASQI